MNSRRRGLGRGLDELFADSGARSPAAPRAERELPVAQLEPNSRQPRDRFDDEELTELANSIAQLGVLQPLVVTGGPDRGGRYRIVAGERRWRAAQRAGLETVPVVFRDVEDERELLELALVENLQRSDLNPLEEAEAFRALSDEFGAFTAGHRWPCRPEQGRGGECPASASLAFCSAGAVAVRSADRRPGSSFAGAWRRTESD